MKSTVTKDSGFFIDTHKNFLNSLSQENIKFFSILNSNTDRIKFVINRGVQFSNVEHKNVKDKAEALKLKELGNKSFQKGNYKEALHLYTESIVKFPENESSTELAIIRANRSAALYHLEQYELSLKDINLAIKLQYPKDLLFKILDRKAMSLLALKQHKSALLALRDTIQALDEAKLPLEKRLRKQKDIEITTAIMLKNKLKDEKIKTEEKTVVKISKTNKIYKAASESIDIKFDQKMGRYAEANTDIDVGEIILKENSHCAVLLQENKKTHCFQCFKRLLIAEACPNCSNVKFCSEYCKNIALKTHHKVECKILETLWASGASIITFMALRIISQKKIEYFIGLKEKLTKKEDWNVYDGSNYLTVHELVKHEKERSAKDLLHRAHMAVFLLSLLKAADYFIEIPEAEQKEIEIFIGSLILEHLQSLQFNAHEISELIGPNEKNSKNIFLGGGLYPTLALFNHSCEPSIIRYFDGTTVVARTIKSLKPGEMVAENYGPIFTQVPKEERRRTLKNQYWFDCCCEPCDKNWPMLNEMNPEIMRFQCENKSCDNVIIVPSNSMEFMTQCKKCGQLTNILKGLKALQDSEMCFKLGESLLNEGNIERGTKKFIELHHTLTGVLVPPFKDYYICQQTLRYCFLACGNRSPEILP